MSSSLPLFRQLRLVAIASVLALAGMVPSARAQITLAKVTAAAIADTTLSPGDMLTVNFQLVPGSSPAAKVEFVFNEGVIATANVPASGVATCPITNRMINGEYYITEVRLSDAYGRKFFYYSNGLLSTGGQTLTGVVAAPGTSADFQALRFTIAGSSASYFDHLGLTSVTRTSPNTLTAGSPIVCQLTPAPDSSEITRVVVRVDAENGDYTLTTFAWDGSGTVSIPTSPDWLNGQYRISSVVVSNSRSQLEVNPNSPALPTALNFTLTGGVAARTYPTLLTATATGGASVSPGQSHGITFTANGGGAMPLASIVATYFDSTGFQLEAKAVNTNSGSLVFTIGNDWVNGPYTLAFLTLTDTAGRTTTYNSINRSYKNPGNIEAPSGFDFAAYNFTVTNASVALPAFTTQPTSQSVAPERSTSLYCAVVSPAGYAITYQWYIGQAGDTSRPFGENSQFLTVPPQSSTTSFWVRVTTQAGSIDSTTATVTINYESTQPKIYSQPYSRTETVGANIFLQVFAVGPAPLSYQWYKNDTPMAGATAARLNFPSLVYGDTGAYKVTITNPQGSLTSAVANLNVLAAPQITTPPTAQTVNYGDPVTFTVAATGGNLEYLWRINGAGISSAVGTNTASLTIPRVDGSHAGDVTVYVYNTVGNITSVPVKLTVIGGPPPSFTADPTAYCTVNQYFSLDVRATPDVTSYSVTGLPAGLTLTAGGEIQGTPTAAGTFPVVVTATNAGGVTKFNLSLTVYPGAFAPVFTLQPQSQTVALHGSVTFTAHAVGTSPSRAQWYFNGQPIPNAGYITYTLTNVSAADAGDYAFEVTGSAGTTRSNAARLTVDTAHSAPYMVGDKSLYQVHLLIGSGDPLTLGPGVTGTGPITYQWLKGHVEIPGATQPTLTIVGPSSLGIYTPYALKATNAYGTVTFDMGDLNLATTPKIAPATQTIAAGQNATITVQSPEAGTRFQWYRGTTGDSSQPIVGATSATLTVSALQASSNYWVLIRPTYNEYAMGAAVVVTGNAAGITISGQPSPQTVSAGGSAFFAVTASGGSALSYQWRRNGTPLAGQTASTLTLNGVTVADSGASFDVVVTSTTGSVTSAAATLTVNAPSGPSAQKVFFGAMPGGGQFALYDRGDGQGAMIGTLPSNGGSFVVKFPIAADGSFSVSVPTATGSSLSPASVSSTPAKGMAGATLTGQISGGGVTGQVGTSGISFSGSIQSSGGAAAMSGFYETPLLNSTSSSVVYLIVGASGSVMGGLVTDSGTQVASGTIGGSGQLDLNLGGGTAVNGTINGGTRALSGQLMTNGTSAGSLGGLAAGATRTDRLVNISTRGLVGDGEKAMFAGFVITGSQPKDVLVRASGQTLTDYGLGGAMNNPVLKIYRGTTEITGNDDWDAVPADAAVLTATALRVGAFAQKAGGKEAALVATLAPGVYSAQVTRAAGSSTGIALVEVYDSGLNPGSEEQKVVNISTRGEVGTGESIMIAGFVITGNSPKKVLIRGVGPTLANFGVGNLLANPQVKLYSGTTELASNDDWGGSASSAAIAAAAASAGGFALDAGSKDAALLLTLAPGLYSAQVSGVNNTTGIVLLEVYEIP